MSYKKIIIDEWLQWCNELTKDLEPYDHYDTGYRDAVDRMDDWMDAQPIINTDDGLICQYRWERDVAISQLEDLGIGFGQEIDGYYLTSEEYKEMFEYRLMYEDLCR